MSDPAGGEAAGGEATGGEATVDTDALLSRLRVIEDQPLESRAEAYTQIHDELRRALEGADAPGGRD